MGKGSYSLLVIALPLLLLQIHDSMAKKASNFTISPSCKSHCGITIPFPYGIGKGCFLDEWYEIICNTSTGRPVPFLKKLDREVVEIGLPDERGVYGPVRIKNPVTSLGCSSDADAEATRPLNATGSPYYVSRNTSLVAVGCNNKASVTYVKPQFVGCESTCDATINRDTVICNGYRCCQASLPDETLQVAGVAIESANANSTEGACRVAFLTDDTYSLSNTTEPEVFHAKGYVTIGLDWHFDASAHLYVNSSDCKNATGFNPYDVEYNLEFTTRSCVFYDSYHSGSSYREYACNVGYRGNPYLPGGCKGIDDLCLKYGEYLCRGDHKCISIPGHYWCEKNTRRKFWTVLGLCLGFGLLISTIVLWWLHKFMRKRKEINRKKKFFKRNGGLLLQQQLTAAEGNIEMTRIFNSEELEKATDKFNENRILGKSGQGIVYKGMLVDGTIVAVKRSTKMDKDKDDPEGFINEIIILSRINHRNIVKLLGYCLETKVPILVYEFIPNGNLSEHLHEQVEDYIMTWESRLHVAIETAGALSYLHSAASHPIYHRDIKSTNILLDKKYRVKVSDFGISRSVTAEHTHLTTQVVGTFGYIDPEYLRSSQYTDKSDVYSFGVVLVELLTGEKPVPSQPTQDDMNLAAHFILAMKQKKTL